PTVLIKRHSAPSAPRIALTLQIRDHSRPAGRRPACPGHPARHAVWNIPEEHVPWRRDVSAGASGPPLLSAPRRVGPVQWCDLPPASVIWDLALGRKPAVEVHSLLEALLVAP
ncbi:MAG: hypothetical protein H7067_07955, partial [Burkholderiales bacterium]|nr:hypothetical protein [Opitutaceae bacterium]